MLVILWKTNFFSFCEWQVDLDLF